MNIFGIWKNERTNQIITNWSCPMSFMLSATKYRWDCLCRTVFCSMKLHERNILVFRVSSNTQFKRIYWIFHHLDFGWFSKQRRKSWNLPFVSPFFARQCGDGWNESIFYGRYGIVNKKIEHLGMVETNFFSRKKGHRVNLPISWHVLSSILIAFDISIEYLRTFRKVRTNCDIVSVLRWTIKTVFLVLNGMTHYVTYVGIICPTDSTWYYVVTFGLSNVASEMFEKCNAIKLHGKAFNPSAFVVFFNVLD